MASTSVKSPPLSYAERARRAQNIKSKISAPPPQTSAPKAVTVAPSPSVASTVNASATSIPPGPSSNSIDANTPSLTPNPSSVITLTTPTVVATPEPKAPIASATSAQTQLAVQALSIVAAHTTSTPPAKPLQNVWSLRAAARAAAPPQVSKPITSVSQPLGGDAAKPLSDVSSNSDPRLTMSNNPSSVPLDDSSALSSLPSDNHLPKGQTPSHPISDPEKWPQVGVTLGATNGVLPPLPLSETRPNGSAAQANASPRKGEKTKWVAIPAAELQAAADALKPRPQPSRKQQPRSGANNTTASNARNPSGRTSASHSRTQSRTASSSGSPRSGGRNAGKKLPSNNDVSQPSELASIPSTSAIPSNPSTNNENLPVPPLHFSLTHPNPQSHPVQPTPYQASAPIFYPRGQQSPSTASRHLGSPSTPLANLVNSTSSSSNISTSSYAYHNPSISSTPYGYAAPAGPLDFNPSSGINGSIPYAHQTSIWNSENPAFQWSHPVPNHEELVSLVMRQRPEESSAATNVGEMVSAKGSALAAQPTINGSSSEAKTGSSGVPASRETMTFGSITLGEAKLSSTPPTVLGGDEACGKIDRAISETKRDSSSEKLINGKENTTPKANGKEGRVKKGKVPSSTASIPPLAAHEQGVENITTSGPSLQDSTEEVQPPSGAAGQQQSSATSHRMEVKYKFGTASNTPPVHGQTSLPSQEASLASTLQVPNQADGVIQTSNTMPAAMSRLAVDDVAREPALNSIAASPLDPRGSVSFGQLPYPPHSHPHHHPHGYPAAASASIEPPMGLGLEHGSPAPSTARPAVPDPDLTVKDYGFGFGNPRLQRELGVERQREISAWMETHNRHYISPTADDGAEHTWGPGQGAREARGAGDAAHVNWRGRRGGFGGPGAGASGSGARGGGFGGAGYQNNGAGRRGRGGNNGVNGFSRGYGRGRGGASSNSQRAAERGPPPFTVTPPPHLQPLGPPSEYYDPRAMPGAYHHHMPRMNGFDSYVPPLIPPVPLSLPNPPLSHVSPPVPVPLSPISFPLDPTRYYLLGQLEYYLSPQNLASDFFLRTQMDSRGWIPIPLIASFNRVKQLTRDEVLVRDVLTLSSIVQVWGAMVRMGGWERYVLPDAIPSTVEEPPQPQSSVGLPVDGYRELPHQPSSPLSSYEQRPAELAETNGLQLDLGDDKPVEDEHAHVPESQAGITLNGTAVGAGETAAGRLVNGHADHYMSASELEEDEDEDDDVVFVMGHEEGRWSSPERRA